MLNQGQVFGLLLYEFFQNLAQDYILLVISSIHLSKSEINLNPVTLNEMLPSNSLIVIEFLPKNYKYVQIGP